jgi:hypothetical protein
MNQGLHPHLEALREQLDLARAVRADADRGPRAHHDADHVIATTSSAIEQFEAEAAFGEGAATLVEKALGLIGNLTMTRHAQLAITALENAEFRLRRHLGPNPH